MRRKNDLLPTERPLSVWLYGPPGVGKSKAAMSVAKLGRTLYIALEDGILQHHTAGIPQENLFLIGPESMTDLNMVYNKLADFQTTYYKWLEGPNEVLLKKLHQLDCWFSDENLDFEGYVPKPFLFVVLDTLTDLQKDTILHQLPRDGKDFTKTGQMQIQQWGKSNAMLDGVTDAFVAQKAPYADLKVNTILVSHEKIEYDSEGGIARVCPAVSGQNPKLIGAKVDIEAFVKLETKQNARLQSFVVQKFGSFRKYDVKDRTDALGNEIMDSAPGACDIMVRIMSKFGWLGKKLPQIEDKK